MLHLIRKSVGRCTSVQAYAMQGMGDKGCHFRCCDTGWEGEMRERVGGTGAPDQAGCEMRTTSPVTGGSVNDMRATTLLRVIVASLRLDLALAFGFLMG